MARIPTRIAILRMNKTVFAMMGTLVYTCRTARIRPMTIPMIIAYFKKEVIKGINASTPITSSDKSANPINKNRNKNIDLLSETTW
jgi:hypothetical protein